jgi:putative FmdB family regulatory protein
MPIYEYRCQSCGHELEKLQRMNDPELRDCPACGKAKLRRLISAAGFRLKGGGWYETDFKQGNKRNLAESSGAKGDSAAGASAGKGDAAAKPESASANAGEKAKPAASDSGSKTTAGPGKASSAGSGAAGAA